MRILRFRLPGWGPALLPARSALRWRRRNLAAPICAASSGRTRYAASTREPTYTLDMSFPNDYPDQRRWSAYLTQSRDGFVNVAETPTSYNLPYSWMRRARLPVGAARRAAPEAWCSRV